MKSLTAHLVMEVPGRTGFVARSTTAAGRSACS